MAIQNGKIYLTRGGEKVVIYKCIDGVFYGIKHGDNFTPQTWNEYGRSLLPDYVHSNDLYSEYQPVTLKNHTYTNSNIIGTYWHVEGEPYFYKVFGYSSEVDMFALVIFNKRNGEYSSISNMFRSLVGNYIPYTRQNCCC